MIKVGTSGFSFADWKGTVYPAGLKEREMLPFTKRNWASMLWRSISPIMPCPPEEF